MKQLGTTLIEVLVAFTVLAMGVFILVNFQNDALRSAGVTQQQSQAVTIAEKKLNELRHYVVINTTAGSSAYDDIVNGNSTVSKNNTSYNLIWLVTENTAPDYKIIKVTVSWTDPANQSQSIVLESIVGKVDVTKSGEFMQSL